MVGLWFEELVVGQVFNYVICCMVIEIDNVMFIVMMYNLVQLYFDEEYMKGIEYGQWIVNLVFMFGLMVGVLVGDMMLGMVVVNLGWDEVCFFKFVFYGDMLYIVIEVIDLCEFKL